MMYGMPSVPKYCIDAPIATMPIVPPMLSINEYPAFQAIESSPSVYLSPMIVSDIE